MKKKNKRMTPLEKLHQKQHELRMLHREEQTRITSDWNYIREHSGSLLVSGISYVFFPRRHKNTDTPNEGKNFWHNVQDNLPFYLAIARESLSIMWYLSRPFCLRWLLRKKKNKRRH